MLVRRKRSKNARRRFVAAGFTLALAGHMFLLLLDPAPVAAAGFAECVSGAAASNLQSSTRFQRRLRDMIADSEPEMEPLATLNMNLQIAFAELRNAKFAYLLRHDPSRVTTDQGMTKFLNFDWTAEDDGAFSDEAPGNRLLIDRVATLTARNNADAGWPRMRKYFRDNLAKSEKYKNLISGFVAGNRTTEKLIADCRRG